MNEELIRLIDDSVRKAEVAEDALRAGAPINGPETTAARDAVHAVNAFIDEHGIEGEDAEYLPMQTVAFSRAAFRSLLIYFVGCLLVIGLVVWTLWWLT